MKKRFLQLGKVTMAVMIGLLFGIAGKLYAYDFSAVCETGQTLYFNIINADEHHVALTYPGEADHNAAWSGYTKPIGDIILPETIQYDGTSYLITSIGNSAFFGCSGLTGNLTIPNSVTAIDEYAFYYCTGMTGNLTIPNSVNSIGDTAFGNCSGFTGSLTIGNSVITIGNYAFLYCSGLTGNLTIPNSVTTIGSFAFANCNNFTGSLTIGNSVITIGSRAFEDCSGLTAIIVDIDNAIYDSRENCNAIIETSTNELVFGCKNTIIPNNITSIGSFAFIDCALSGNLIIPNSVISIGDCAFYGCSGLTGNLIIPSLVTSIGTSAFDNCTGLMEIMMLGINPPYLGYYSIAFSNTNNCPIYVPYESLNDYKTAWNNYQSRIFPWLQKSLLGYVDSENNWHFIASPLVANTAPTAVDNMITESNYDLYRFDQSENLEWQNYEYSENTPSFVLVNGQGYLYANEDDVSLVFKGNFNENETKEVELIYIVYADLPGWNLVGNPFPVSAYANKSYYTMNEDGTAIEPVAISMETAIPACTGVLVKATATGQSVTFSKTAPSSQGNQGALQIAVVQNNTRGNVMTDKAIVSFNEGDELGKFVFNKDNAKLYIPQGKEDYAIVYAEKHGEMPLNFEATENGTYTISVNPENVEMNYLHLIDNMTGEDIDLLVNPSCTFEARTNDYASRFCLVFSARADAGEDNEVPFAFISNSSIIVSDTNADATLQIMDMTGHIIVSTDIAHRISTNGMPQGVYALRLIDGDDMKTQKIVIH